MQIFEIFQAAFYWLDMAIAIGFVVIAIISYKYQLINKLTFILFWIGVAIGLTFEIPIFLITEIGLYPMLQYLITPPYPFYITIILHSFWDGGLFLIGIMLIYRFCEAPHFEKFNIKELLLLMIWGQAQAIGIEMLGSFGGAWEYIPYPWNPPILILFGHYFTIFIQIVWLIVPIIFYFIALKLKQKE